MEHSSLFGVVAPEVGWAPPLRYLLRRARILSLLKDIPPGDLVEIGSGAGALLDDFVRKGFRATGVETSPRALAIAQALAEATNGGQQVLSVPDAAWASSRDLVCAFDVLEHIEDDESALREWTSWLKPDGLLMLSVPAHQSRWNSGDEWAGHWRRYDRGPLRDLLHAVGMKPVHFECYGFPVANLTEYIGARTYRRLLASRSTIISREEASEASGVERSAAVRIYRYLASPPGRIGLRIALLAQLLTRHTNLGSGYLVLARRA